MNTYQEKLQHPKWQKKRLEILERDSFQCRLCKDEKTTLHIHHLKYINGNDPWQYKNNDLMTVCKDCHKLIHGYNGTSYLKPLSEIEIFKKKTTTGGLFEILINRKTQQGLIIWDNREQATVVEVEKTTVEQIVYFFNKNLTEIIDETN